MPQSMTQNNFKKLSNLVKNVAVEELKSHI